MLTTLLLGRCARRPVLAAAPDDLLRTSPARSWSASSSLVEVTGHVNLTADDRPRRLLRRRPTASSSPRSAGSCRSSSRRTCCRRRARGSGSRARAAPWSARRSRRRSTASPARRRSGRWRPCSFVVSAGALWLARPRTMPDRSLSSGMRRELAVGFRYVISVPWIWTGIAAATVDPDDRDGAVQRPAAAHRARALPPRRRLIRPALQPDGRRDGRRLAGLGELASAPAPRGRLLRGLRDQRPRASSSWRCRRGTGSRASRSSGAASGSASASRRG